MKRVKVNPWNPLPPYAQIEEKLVRSKGFSSLKAHTKWLFVEFRLRYKGNNPREIILTKDEAKKFMDKATFKADCRILIKLGFIDLVKRGGFYNQPHIWGLSKRWEKYGTKDFIEVDIDKLFPEILKKK
ncbi:unnamed protein product [marine sediment metagenome]|uniref:Bacteriophage lambda Replication protein O N-terminal domain-containing protein n=1 Tax=marine sediment metagenome TaxID=412755 RepID=X1L8S5_9ZZZZ